MKRPRPLCALMVAGVLVAGACSSDGTDTDSDTDPETSTEQTTEDTSTDTSSPDTAAPSDEDAAEQLMSDVERAEPASDAPVDAVVQGSNNAGFDLQRQLGVGDENLVVSPASLSIAFAMAGAGADDATAAQLADVFGFPGDDGTHEAMNALLRDLEPDNANDPEEGAETVMSSANSGWAQEGQEIGSDYLDTLAAQYGAGLFVTDFAGDTEGSRRAINGWVDEETRGLIPELIGEGQLSPETVYTLVNALYFKATWSDTFDEEATEPRPFTLADGSTQRVPTMFESQREASYLVGDDLTAVTLPYGDGEFQMKVVMPLQLGEFVGTVDAQQWAQLGSSFEDGEVNLTIPKWETESNLNLNQSLSAMGLEIPGGHYPGIAPQVTVGSVLQAATITVDETGTEAAAATAIMMPTAAPAPDQQPVDITIDRPFFYTIEHVPTGLILFAGQVVNPG